MLHNILIGLDGTQGCNAAVDLAIRWAQRFGTNLVGLGVVDEPSIRAPEALPIGASHFKEHRDEVRLSRAKAQVAGFLDQFARRCSAAGASFQVLEDVGLPESEILLEAQRFDLILLGRQTHFHFATQESPDNVLPNILKNAPRPVVTVPERLRDGKSVLVAYDGSLQASRALASFQASGLHGGDHVHVVSVGPDGEAANRHAVRAAEYLRSHGIETTPHVAATAKGSAETLLEQARLLDARLMVMGCYGQPTLREFFLGSVTRTMLQECDIPLFLDH